MNTFLILKLNLFAKKKKKKKKKKYFQKKKKKKKKKKKSVKFFWIGNIGKKEKLISRETSTFEILARKNFFLPCHLTLKTN